MNTQTHDPKGERHRLTVLFSDLVGSTVLGRDIESEHLSELLGQLRDIWHRAVAKHGGRVIRTQGDGVLAVFGYPRSGEDDGRRAAEAAIDIHRWVGLLRPDGVSAALMPLRMHSGIHAGTLLLTEGDIESGRYDLIGDVVNTAAHLSRQAAPGQILASVDALGPHANFFELGAPVEAASGMPQARAVLRRSMVTRRFDATSRRGLTPFIGRDEIFDYLTGFLDEPQPASQRCAIVVGGPGLGKTRLLEEVLRHCETDQFKLLRGSCESYVGAEVLQPFLQMLRAYFGIRPDASIAEADDAARDALQPWLAQLGPRAEAIIALASTGADARGGHMTVNGVVGALLGFFAVLSEQGALVLVIDDWQWSDDASRQLLEKLLQLPNGPRFILAARPRDDGTEWISGAPQLRLEPFGGQETDLAVRRWVPQADPFLVARVHAYAGGVPLFIEELCHSIAANDPASFELRNKQGGWIATLVASRLARLPPNQVNVVRAAAVIGNTVPKGLLFAACGSEPDPATLRALADADFLFADPAGDVLRFKHGITRDAVYDTIGLHERQALHRRIEAGLLARSEQAEREDTLEALAYHSRGAGHWENAAHYAERAGDKAMAAFALDVAGSQYKAAMDALDQVPDRSREQSLRWCLLANKLGMANIFDPLSLTDDTSVFEKAVAIASSLGDIGATATAYEWLGYMCYGFGRFREGATHTRTALEWARKLGERRLIARIEAVLGQILAASCQYDEATALIEAAISTKRSRPHNAIAVGSAYSLSCKGSILADRGDFDGAHECFAEAMSLVKDSTHPVVSSVRNWISVALVWQGRWREAEELAVEGARAAENMRSLLMLAACRAASGFARWSTSGDADGLQQLRDAAQWMERRNFHFYTSVQYSWLVEAAADANDVDTARRYAAHVLGRAREGERLGEAMACRALAKLAARRGDFVRSRRWLLRAETSAGWRGSLRDAALNLAARAELHALQGQGEAAHQTAAEAAEKLHALGMHWHAERAIRSMSGVAAGRA
ncbi:adenylate/guanylate cyclase domain-containing protein [uncultured Bradyrhizobium sp.]|jgi:class 3 adenylate cyclase/tetratricopeptide (TPR) repeat protein|uniref:ATP-binding protein n=1 Tax=uncultured Bradyrhizobium sp. TaxID=199684 RepID=UPI0026138C9F|nr:adenylate/guanylate cyclase domain-containing protein [uncultured Bradyrhizobium sp.]